MVDSRKSNTQIENFKCYNDIGLTRVSINSISSKIPTNKYALRPLDVKLEIRLIVIRNLHTLCNVQGTSKFVKSKRRNKSTNWHAKL